MPKETMVKQTMTNYIHMGTDDGTVPWCCAILRHRTWSGAVTTIDKPTSYDWCPDCVRVFKNIYPGRPLPPTLKPCKTNVLHCGNSNEMSTLR